LQYANCEIKEIPNFPSYRILGEKPSPGVIINFPKKDHLRAKTSGAGENRFQGCAHSRLPAHKVKQNGDAVFVDENFKRPLK